MSKAWPNDRKLVDKDGRILDQWLRPLDRLLPALQFEPADYTTLAQIIDAFESATEEDPFSLNAALGALPVDEEPDFSAGYVIGYSGSAGTRIPLSEFGSVLISSTTLVGSSSVSVEVPTGFRDVEVRVTTLSMSTTATPLISFSEDGGSTFLSQLFQIFTDGFSQTGTSTTPTFSVTTSLTAATVLSGACMIRDYQSLEAKITSDFGLYSTTGVAWAGSRYMGASVAPINLVNLSASAGTFDLGKVELIGFR